MTGRRLSRRRFLAGLGVASAAMAGCSGSSGAGWRRTELEPVRSGGPFTLQGLQAPVLIETFAVWCPVCTVQQNQIAKLLATTEDPPTPVSLNVDPNESASAVRTHAEDHGFDWRYAVAPAEMTAALVERFGSEVTSAPSAPVVVLCPDGSASLLKRGVKSAAELRAAAADCEA